MKVATSLGDLMSRTFKKDIYNNNKVRKNEDSKMAKLKRSTENEDAKPNFHGPEQLSSWQLSDTSSEVNEYLEKEDFRVISKKDKHNQVIVT